MTAIDRVYRESARTRFPLPTSQQVSELEERLGVDLPPDYRQFILQYNGGTFEDLPIVSPETGAGMDCLTILCGINASNPFGELAAQTGLPPDLFDDNDPVQVLPIGYCVGGSLIYVLTDPENSGCIGLKKPYYEDFTHLADGIELFFELLRKPGGE
jgi:hypothetical protein